MSKKKPGSRPHYFTNTVHEEVAAQTPIIPQRNEQAATGRQRILETRERVGKKTERELHKVQFPTEK